MDIHLELLGQTSPLLHEIHVFQNIRIDGTKSV
jgi:hypothetical protein